MEMISLETTVSAELFKDESFAEYLRIKIDGMNKAAEARGQRIAELKIKIKWN